MNQKIYKNHAVRSPIQYRPQQKVTKQDQDSPIQEALRKLCQAQYRLCAAFSPDTGVMSELKTPGLLAVKCELSLEGHGPIGIGHGSTVISAMNRATPRALYSSLNGSLMSAINAGIKTLDVIRLGEANEQAASDKQMYRDTYRRKENYGDEAITDRQRQYLISLSSSRIEDEGAREQFVSSLDSMSKADASEAIARWAE